MLRHLMKSWHLNIWKIKIWLSQERKKLLKWNKKRFSLLHKCSLLDLQNKLASGRHKFQAVNYQQKNSIVDIWMSFYEKSLKTLTNSSCICFQRCFPMNNAKFLRTPFFSKTPLCQVAASGKHLKIKLFTLIPFITFHCLHEKLLKNIFLDGLQNLYQNLVPRASCHQRVSQSSFFAFFWYPNYHKRQEVLGWRLKLLYAKYFQDSSTLAKLYYLVEI